MLGDDVSRQWLRDGHEEPSLPIVRIVVNLVLDVLDRRRRHAGRLEPLHDLDAGVLARPAGDELVQRLTVLLALLRRCETRIATPGWVADRLAELFPFLLALHRDGAPALGPVNTRIGSVGTGARSTVSFGFGDSAIHRVV